MRGAFSENNYSLTISTRNQLKIARPILYDTNMKIYGVDLNNLVQNMDYWWAYLNTIMSFRVP
jgi:hypothetical protein